MCSRVGAIPAHSSRMRTRSFRMHRTTTRCSGELAWWSVTPRFPDGLTVVQGQGRYPSQDQQLHEEPTRLLIILHPRASLGESDGKIRQLCWEYIRRFEQESVLRSDSTSQTSFISAGQSGVVQEPAGDTATRTLSK